MFVRQANFLFNETKADGHSNSDPAPSDQGEREAPLPEMKTERLQNYCGPVTNTDIWDSFVLRPDDIIVDTPPKCGTTWMLHIVMMLIYGRAIPNAGGSDHAPWLDCGFRNRSEIAQFLNGLERRRCIKSHTPMDGILYAPEPTYIVVYRHPVDAHFSLRTHSANMTNDSLAFMFPDDEAEGLGRFITAPATDSGTDDLTVASIAHHYLEAKKRAPNGNVHFYHYADMSRGLPVQIERLADILNIDCPDTLRDEVAEAPSCGAMRKAVAQSDRRCHEDSPFHDLARFYASGTSNKWAGRVSDALMADYAARIAELLPPEEVSWLEWGERRSA